METDTVAAPPQLTTEQKLNFRNKQVALLDSINQLQSLNAQVKDANERVLAQRNEFQQLLNSVVLELGVDTAIYGFNLATLEFVLNTPLPEPPTNGEASV